MSQTPPILPMVQRMDYAEYDALPGVRWSHLARIRDGSELHLRDYLDRRADRDTDSLRRGRLAHTLLLQPERYEEDYTVFPGRRQGKAWEAFEKEHADTCILRPEDIDRAEGMVDALRSNEHAAPYLGAGLAEGTIEWTDGRSGVACKARPDWLTLAPEGLVIVDVKTARTIDDRFFGIAANRYGYHAQLAHYRAGLIARGVQVARVVILAVESAPPHDVGVFVLDEPALDLGASIVDDMLTRYAVALRTDRWPGRFGAPVPLKLPDYVFGTIEIEDAD